MRLKVSDRVKISDRGMTAMQFLRDYWGYVNELNIRQVCADWLRHFGAEILRSPLNQVSFVLGVVGIAGAISGFFKFLKANPLVPLVAIGSGGFVLLLLSMFSFHLSRRVAASMIEDSKAELEKLWPELMRREKMTKASIREFLGLSEQKAVEVIDKGREQGVLEQDHGTWKITERMKPILRRELRNKKEGVR